MSLSFQLQTLDLLRNCCSFVVSRDFPKDCRDVVAFAGVNKQWRSAASDYLMHILQLRISQKNLQVTLQNHLVTNDLYFYGDTIFQRPDWTIMSVLGKVVMFLGKDAFVCKKVCRAWKAGITNWLLFNAVSQEYKIIVVRRASTSNLNEKALLDIRRCSLQSIRSELDSLVGQKKMKLLKRLELAS